MTGDFHAEAGQTHHTWSEFGGVGNVAGVEGVWEGFLEEVGIEVSLERWAK